MVQPLRESRDRYEELKQIDDAMNEVRGICVCTCVCVFYYFYLRSTCLHVLMCSGSDEQSCECFYFRCRKRKVRTWLWGRRNESTKVGVFKLAALSKVFLYTIWLWCGVDEMNVCSSVLAQTSYGGKGWASMAVWGMGPEEDGNRPSYWLTGRMDNPKAFIRECRLVQQTTSVNNI